MKHSKSTQKGLGILDVSLCLLMLVGLSTTLIKNYSNQRQFAQLQLLSQNMNDYAAAVSSYLRDNRNHAKDIDNTELLPEMLIKENYLTGNVNKAFLSSKDMLTATIKYDSVTKQLRALVYNKCPPDSAPCHESEIHNIAGRLAATIGIGGGFKKYLSDNSYQIKGNGEAWIIKPNDPVWKDVNFDYASVFKLVSYTPYSEGRFLASAARFDKMYIEVIEGGRAVQSETINSALDIRWSPIFENDTIKLSWDNKGLSYVMVNMSRCPNGFDTHCQASDRITVLRKLVKTSSLPISAIQNYFGNSFLIEATPYDDNGRAGNTFVTQIAVNTNTKQIISKAIIDFDLTIYDIQSVGMTEVAQCVAPLPPGGPMPLEVPQTDVALTLKKINLEASDLDYNRETTFLSEKSLQILFTDSNKKSKALNLNFKSPAAITPALEFPVIENPEGHLPFFPLLRLEGFRQREWITRDCQQGKILENYEIKFAGARCSFNLLRPDGSYRTGPQRIEITPTTGKCQIN